MDSPGSTSVAVGVKGGRYSVPVTTLPEVIWCCYAAVACTESEEWALQNPILVVQRRAVNKIETTTTKDSVRTAVSRAKSEAVERRVQLEWPPS